MIEEKCRDLPSKDLQKKIEEDQESFEEKCWRPKRETDSRPYLIRDASHRSKFPPDPKCSVTKSTYTKPVYDNRPTMGIRTSMLLKKFQEEAENEVAEERRPKTPTGTYITSYDCNFQIEGFEVDDKFFMKNNDLYAKYPLYSTATAPTTYTSFKLKKDSSDLTPGITQIKSRSYPFKKDSEFSKPVYEKLDSSW